MRQLPYNTGKVKIGEFYDPPPQNHITREGEFIQSVLLGTHGGHIHNTVQFVLYLVLLVVVFTLVGVFA